MISLRHLFFQNIAQTSHNPIALEIQKAKGIYLYDSRGKEYIDLISGIAVSNVGHLHKNVVNAVKKQLNHYMHTMVYGEHIQSPQVKLAKLITDVLPKSMDNVYFVNSGSEANEGALKLAKRFTGRSEIIYCKNAYHGSTHGALSVLGNEDFKNSFRPLLPDTQQINFNCEKNLDKISKKTACVIVEPIQGEAGIITPKRDYLKKLLNRCNQKKALLILDEIQTGFGRTGKLFAFEHYNIEPHIITFAKGLGGGMPIGAFVAPNYIMKNYKKNPILGHITTFGGHPVSCAASLASLKTIITNNLIDTTKKEALFKKILKHKHIKEVRGKGLMLAVQLSKTEQVQKLMDICMKNGVIIDWFLFCDNAFRIAPPLIINQKQIKKACAIILKCLNQI